MTESEKIVLFQPDAEDWDSLAAVAKIDDKAFALDSITIFNLSQFARCKSLYCLKVGETIVGEAVVFKNIYDDGALVFGFAVDSNHFNKGYGYILLQKLLVACRNAGIAYLQLTMNPDNPAVKKLYIDKCGFKKVKELENHPQLSEPRWLLQLDLI